MGLVYNLTYFGGTRKCLKNIFDRMWVWRDLPFKVSSVLVASCKTLLPSSTALMALARCPSMSANWASSVCCWSSARSSKSWSWTRRFCVSSRRFTLLSINLLAYLNGDKNNKFQRHFNDISKTNNFEFELGAGKKWAKHQGKKLICYFQNDIVIRLLLLC